MTLFNIKRIINHCFETLTLANYQNLRFPKKINKKVKNHQKKVKNKRVIFIPKKTNSFDFSSQKFKKKIIHFFLGFFTWNHPLGKCLYFASLLVFSFTKDEREFDYVFL